MRYSETHLRQTDVLPEAVLATPITLIGCGGIGSNAAYLLAKMGFQKFTLIDPDKVEAYNCATQMFLQSQVEMDKAAALAEQLLVVNPHAEIEAYTRLFEPGDGSQITICGVDTMDARISIWDEIKKNPDVTYYLDGRMGLEIVRCYAFSPFDTKKVTQYEATLYTSAEAEEAPCTAKAIGYNTWFIASVLASMTKQLACGETPPLEVMGHIGKMYLRPTQA